MSRLEPNSTRIAVNTSSSIQQQPEVVKQNESKTPAHTSSERVGAVIGTKIASPSMKSVASGLQTKASNASGSIPSQAKTTFTYQKEGMKALSRDTDSFAQKTIPNFGSKPNTKRKHHEFDPSVTSSIPRHVKSAISRPYT